MSLALERVPPFRGCDHQDATTKASVNPVPQPRDTMPRGKMPRHSATEMIRPQHTSRWAAVEARSRGRHLPEVPNHVYISFLTSSITTSFRCPIRVHKTPPNNTSSISSNHLTYPSPSPSPSPSSSLPPPPSSKKPPQPPHDPALLLHRVAFVQLPLLERQVGFPI